MGKKGIISDIQKFSLHDGPGIRTTVFFKGCPLRCIWCHNPEAVGFTPFLRFQPKKCIGCGACYDVCGTGALRMENGERLYDKARCKSCFACVKACPANALTVVGREIEAKAVVEEVLPDRPYYETSGGGVTLSGGEPTAQPGFALEILQLLKKEGIHTAIETSMCTGFRGIEPLLPWLDLIYCDIKLLDNDAHIKYVGAGNKDILDGIEKLAKTGKQVVIRTPLIPGITDSDENIRGIAAWIREHAPGAEYELLNYNPLAESKWDEIGDTYLVGSQKMLSDERMKELRALVHQERRKNG